MAAPKISRKCLGNRGRRWHELRPGASDAPSRSVCLAQRLRGEQHQGIGGCAIRAPRHGLRTRSRMHLEALGEVYESAPALTEWDAAFAAMQSDLATLIGMNEPRLPSYTPNQASKGWFGSIPSRSMRTLHTGHVYMTLWMRALPGGQSSRCGVGRQRQGSSLSRWGRRGEVPAHRR